MPTDVFSDDVGLLGHLLQVGVEGQLKGQIVTHFPHSVTRRKDLKTAAREVLMLFNLAYIASTDVVYKHITEEAEHFESYEKSGKLV
jgi:hypothetical protein